jgi:MscS family membrane protein
MDGMNHSIQSALQVSPEVALSVEIGLIVGIAGIASILGQWILGRIHRGVSEQSVWVKTLIESIYSPLHWVIWVSAALYSADEVGQTLGLENWGGTYQKLQRVAITLTLTWFALAWRGRIESNMLRKWEGRKQEKARKATIQAVSRIFQFIIVLVGGLSIIGEFINVQAFLAVGGIGAVAAGYSASDVVKNFFGGLVINITRPFSVGDWINSPDKSIEGTVEDIGWYQTRIRTFDKRPIYVPNGLFPSIVVRNPSRMSNRRILTTIGIRYEDIQRVAPITQAIEEMLKNDPVIDTKMALMVHLTAFGPHSLDINVYCFTKTAIWKTWRDQQQGVFLKIAEIIDQHGAEIAFPTQVVKLEQEEHPHPA